MVELGRCVESYLEGEVQLARHDAPARSRCSDIAIQVGILAELVQTGSQFCNVFVAYVQVLRALQLRGTLPFLQAV